MATYLAHDALRLPAASLLANSGLCVNIEIEIWLLLGVNVATALSKIHSQLCSCASTQFQKSFAARTITEWSGIHYQTLMKLVDTP